MKVEVVRSPRRRKTVQARVIGDVIRVLVPAHMSRRDEARWVSELVGRLERRRSAGQVDLTVRAKKLAARYDLDVPKQIRWVDNQESRWGSCTPRDGTIRISSRLASEPGWVLDYVIVHELAHLRVCSHSPAFWELVYRYPLTERARGFLIARCLDPTEDPEAGGAGDDEMDPLADMAGEGDVVDDPHAEPGWAFAGESGQLFAPD
jgi:predicted metal-dependent hydrolase